MSVKSSAKPIVRRRRVDSTRRPHVPTLFSVPDLRVLKELDEPSGVVDDIAEMGIQDIPDQIEDIDAMSLNGLQADVDTLGEGSGDTEDVQSVDLNRPRTEFGIAPPRDVIGSATAVESDERETSDASNDEQKPARKKRSKPTESVPTVELKTPLGDAMFSKNLKKNLSTLGTIAGAIIVCTLVARTMKHEGAAANSDLVVASTELIDQLPIEGETLQPEVVAEVVPQFDPAELQASVQAGGSSPFNRPLGQVANQAQSQDMQSQAINRVAMQPSMDGEQSKVDPFALPGFGGQEMPSNAGTQSRQVSRATTARGVGQTGYGQRGFVQPALAQPQTQPSVQPSGPVFAAPQNSVQRQDFSTNSNAQRYNAAQQIPRPGFGAAGVRSDMGPVANNNRPNVQPPSQTPRRPAVSNRFGQGNATAAYPTTSQDYQPFNQLKATLEQGEASRLGDTRGGQFGTQRVPQRNSGPVFNNNGGVNR